VVVVTTVYLVQCCFDVDVKHTVGPYADETVAHHVADAIETHFWNGGDQYTRVEAREVRG